MVRTILLAASTLVLSLSCNKAPPPPKDDGRTDAANEPVPPNVHQGAGGSGPADRAPAPAPARGTGAAEPAQGGGTTAAGGAPDRDTAAAGTGGTSGAAEAPPDPKALLKQVRSKRTPDDEALDLLAKAEAAGASVRDVARTALARGKALFATPDRAKAFFEWAAKKDPKFADPVFELARQAAMRGDVPAVKEHLAEVAKRHHGKKLLQQIDFDPTWDIVKDDPDVRALLK